MLLQRERMTAPPLQIYSSLQAERLTRAWTSDPLCAWCDREVRDLSDADLSVVTGRVLHAGVCAHDFSIRRNMIYTAIFAGGIDLSFD